MAAFGSSDLNSLKGFHKSLAKCVKRANKASRPRSEKHVSGEGDSSVADSSVASHSTGISLWSYSKVGSKRSGKCEYLRHCSYPLLRLLTFFAISSCLIRC